MTAYQSKLRAALAVNTARNNTSYTSRVYAGLLRMTGEADHASSILQAVEQAEHERFTEESLKALDQAITAARRSVREQRGAQ
jgi:hypothetical protein